MADVNRAKEKELERSNAWAASIQAKLDAAGKRIDQLQTELKSSNAWAIQLDRDLTEYVARVAELQGELAKSNAWAGKRGASTSSA